MENRFQGKAPEDDVIGQNNKRPSISLNMGGLWDVVPRLDHYRYIFIIEIFQPLKLIKVYHIYQINYILLYIIFNYHVMCFIV